MGAPSALASQPGWSLIGSALEIAQWRSRANTEISKPRNVGTSEDQTGSELSENPRKMSENIKK
jgi:hypothetical protein